MATLGLAGLRISEMVDLRVAQVDLQPGRFKLADAKTDAGVREVEISLYLRHELLEHQMDRQSRSLPMGPTDYFFGTATGPGAIPTASATGSLPAPSHERDPGRARTRAPCRRSLRIRFVAPAPRSRP